jgi:hypothetical protein
MRMQPANFLVRLEKEQLTGFNFQVKEVLDTNYLKTRERIFCTADLWNIQRHRKAIPARRQF